MLFFDTAPPGDRIETEALWVYDLRTNKRFTLRERPLKRDDLDDCVACYAQQHQRRVEGERFRRFSYEALVKRDKLNLDIFWLKFASATDPDSLPPPPPDEVAAEIVASLELALD